MGEQAPKAERLMVGHGQVQPRLQDGVSHAAARVPEAHPLRPASRGSGSWRDTPSQSPPTGDFPGGPVVKTLPSNAGGVGSIPGWGARIPQASRPKSKSIKQKQYCNKFNKDFKNGPHWKKRKKTNPQVLLCRAGPGDRGPAHPHDWALTQASHGEHAGGGGRWDAVGEHGLQHVVGEGHGDDGQARGVHDEHGAPEQQEAGMSQGPSGAGLPGPSGPSGPRCREQGCTLSPGTQVCCGRPEASFGPGRQGPPCQGLCSIDKLFQQR